MNESSEYKNYKPSFVVTTVLDNLLEGFQIISRDYRYLYVNNAIAIHGRRSKEELLGNKMMDVYPGIEKTEVFAKIKKCMEESSSITMEHEFVFPDHSKNWFELRLQPIPEGVFILSIDISERKLNEENAKAKEKAEKANRAKDSFLATMSHEIRTPLTGMLGMLEVLSLTPLDAEQRTTLDAAWNSGRSLLRIVSDILDWSKIEEGKLELSPHPTSIEHLLKEIVNTYSRVASAKNVVLWFHKDARLTSTYIVDSLRLSQILNNFVSNSLKFTKEGEVEVRATLVKKLEGKDRIRFSVKDTGIGISKENQKKLFQYYQQESAETARMYGGTGLGLAICQKLSELMNGEISLESEIDQGSIFSITLSLPISNQMSDDIIQSHPEVEHREVKPLFSNHSESPMILAVDDHPTNRDLIGKQLKLLGLRVEVAESGVVALEKWKNNSFSLIITDCHMPLMDGYELTKLIRHLEIEEKIKPTPIIAWTANILAEEAVRCYNAGMNDFLTKPTDLEQLRQKLSKWLVSQEIVKNESLAIVQNIKLQELPIDSKVLNKMVTDPLKRIKILKDFHSQVVKDYQALVKLLENKDLFKSAEILHRIKGASLMVGANNLSNLCNEFEMAIKNENVDDIRLLEANIKKAIVQIEEFNLGIGNKTN